MTDDDKNFQKFRGFASVLLSILFGILITIPLASDSTQYVPLLGAAAGCLVGLRRRSSQAYFYFIIIACGVMTSLLLGQITFQQ